MNLIRPNGLVERLSLPRRQVDSRAMAAPSRGRRRPRPCVWPRARNAAASRAASLTRCAAGCSTSPPETRPRRRTTAWRTPLRLAS